MLEESDIEDLHFDKADSSTQSSNDNDTEPESETESDEQPKCPKVDKNEDAAIVYNTFVSTRAALAGMVIIQKKILASDKIIN